MKNKVMRKGVSGYKEKEPPLFFQRYRWIPDSRVTNISFRLICIKTTP
jgi:hypothetical protein